MFRKNFEIKNDLKEIDILAADVLELCRNHGIDENSCHDIRLALEEAVSNTIKYAYDDSQIHKIRVVAGTDNQKFFLEIEDDGKPFNPLEKPAPNLSLSVEEKPIGGLGIYLLRKIMDQVEYQRIDSRNVLRMTKITPAKNT